MKIHTTVLFLLVTFVYVSAIEFKLTKNGNTCILFNAANSSQIKISNGTSEKTFRFDAASVDQGNSDCTTPQLWLSFPNNVKGKFLFRKNAPNNSTFVDILVQFVPSAVFTGDSDTGIKVADDTSNKMSPPYLKSYECTAEESIGFNRPDNYTVDMMVSNVRLQAFDVQSGQFSDASICAADMTTVPTTEPTTQPQTTEKPTTEHNNGTTNSTTEPTTQPSNGTSEHTTEHSNVTTAGPTTTPLVPTTTAPNPPLNKFELRNGNDTCIIFHAGISFKISYDKTDNKTAVATINLPNATQIDQGRSTCNGTSNSQSLSLDFFNGWKLSMKFGLENKVTMLVKADNEKYSLQTVTLTYVIDTTRFPDAAKAGETVTVTTQMPVSTLEATGSYKCQKDVTLNLNATDSNHPISMNTQNLQYEAFHTGSFTGFDDATECPLDTESNSIVPIAVGAALAGLVIIVLIAYLIGRKRSRGGYEQV